MDRDVTIVLGKTGYGKSLWTSLYTCKLDRLLVYDLMREHYVTYFDPQVLADQINALEPDDEIEKFRIGLADPDLVPGLGHLSFHFGNNLLVLEELSTLFPKGARMPDWLRTLVFLGRHKKCSLLAVAQRAYSVPIDLRSQANRVVTFQQHEGDDLSWLREFYGSAIVHQIPNLPKLCCYDYHDGNVTVYSIAYSVKKQLGINLMMEDSEKMFVLRKEVSDYA